MILTEMINRKPTIGILRKGGLTYDEIGIILGISKQRVYQIETGYIPSAKGSRGAKRRYARKHILIINGKMVRVNKRERKGICEICGRTIDWRLHYHHWNDDKPSLGMWVCQRCHYGCGFIEKRFDKYMKLKKDIEEGMV